MFCTSRNEIKKPVAYNPIYSYSKIALLCCIFSCILFPKAVFSQDYQDFDSLSAVIEQTHFSHGAQSEQALKALYQIAESHADSVVLNGRCIYYESLINYSQGLNDSTIIDRINHYLNKLDEKKFPLENAMLYYALSLTYIPKGSYAEAFSSALHAFEKFKQLNSRAFLSKALITLANICSYTNNFNLAEDYYRQAVGHASPYHQEYYQAYSSIYYTLAKLGQTAHAIDSFLCLIPLLENYGDTGILATANMNLAVCYAYNQDYQQALQYFRITERYMNSIDNKRIETTLLQNIGGYYYSIKNMDSAFIYFRRVLHIAQQTGNLELQSLSLFGLSQIYASRKNSDSAYFYLASYNLVHNKLHSQSQAIDAYRDYISAVLEVSQNKLKIAEQELQLKNRRFTIFLILSIGIIFLTILIFTVIQQKKRQQSLIKEAETRDLEARLQHEKKIQQLHEKQHKEALEAKVREVASYSLLLSNKNNILQQIEALANQLGKAKEEERERLNKQIHDIIKSNLNVDNDWQTFMLHFSKVHPDFFNKLKKISNILTENEIRLCAYLRIGMNAKQIAQILNVSPGSIRINRYRLKKKFYLAEEDNLDDFIRNV